MTNKLYFISGLPRSGSTLLSALLRQNPRFHAGISGPVAPMCNALLNIMGAGKEFATSFTEERKVKLLRGIFENYYTDLSEEAVIFDSNRSWCARLALLNQLFSGCKVICCVRNVAWIMDSFERLVQKQPLVYSRMFNDDNERGTVYSRTEALARHNRIVGYSLSALREAFYGQFSSSLLLIDYELLARFPQKSMTLLYEFLDEEPFEHDPENVIFEDADFDAHMGIADMHKVRNRISFQERTTLLPPDIFAKYEKLNFWHKMEGTAASVIRVPAQAELKDGI
jgi:sulfotransferase